MQKRAVAMVVTLLAVVLINKCTTKPTSDYWTTGAPMPTARSGAIAGVIGGRLFVLGGRNAYLSPGPLVVMEVYDPLTDSWTTKAPKDTLSDYDRVGVIDGKLYVFGLYYTDPSTGDDVASSLDVYDPVSDTWTSKTPMPITAGCVAVGAIDGKLYVAGTHYVSDTGPPIVVGFLYAYDPATDAWTSKAPIPTCRRKAFAGVIDGKLYVVGGDEEECGSLGDVYCWSDVLEVYDPVSDTWTSKTPMPELRDESVGGVIEGKLYIAAGWYLSWPYATLVYDPASDTWATRAHLPTYRRGAAGGVIDGKRYVVGGGPSGHENNILEIYTP